MEIKVKIRHVCTISPQMHTNQSPGSVKVYTRLILSIVIHFVHKYLRAASFETPRLSQRELCGIYNLDASYWLTGRSV